MIAFIDDASSEVMYARFEAVESTQAYLEGLRAYIRRYGCPVALYSDRHSIFCKHDPEDEVPTQFERALAELGIEGIQALSPQAKGRVERLFQTRQDRLVKALRLAGVKDRETANAFLPAYLSAHNRRFAVPPADGMGIWPMREMRSRSRGSVRFMNPGKSPKTGWSRTGSGVT